MSILNIDIIKKTITEIPFVRTLYFLEQEDGIINGKFEIAFEGLIGSLDFGLRIFPQYPFKCKDIETITFINHDLMMYNHVMSDGSICIHTSHDTNIYIKLKTDFTSLKNWIIKYYINKDNDKNYEHIIVSEKLIDDCHYSYIFTDLDYEFKKGDFGDVNISFLSNGIYKGKTIFNFIVQNFDLCNGPKIDCTWSTSYKNLDTNNLGYFIFIENVPATFNRFVFKNWTDFTDYFPEIFKNLLHQVEIDEKKRGKTLIPLFIGYRTVEKEIHWQVAILKFGEFPLRGIPERNNNIKTGRWLSELVDKNIEWVITRNSSYNIFFGRGVLTSDITNSKILIIGVGAIGSIIAKTLVKGGCKYIDISDYDVKEPENVCRSEYTFKSGLRDKIDELVNVLSENSPFLEISTIKNELFESFIKISHKMPKGNDLFSTFINQYDIVFDCTTDNDLMYILNSLELNCNLINISITNHAKDLVCAFYPNIYHFVNSQFSYVLKNDLEDLYTPTGCWSPTFKASYNDINLLVQMALKHINILYQDKKPKNNFIIKTDDSNVFDLKIEEF